MKEIQEAEQLILNYFTDLFIAGNDCSDAEAILDARRWVAYDNGDFEKYAEISIELAEAIKSH